ncbi:hypothetical protein Tco_1444109 [Tanacetum coccineum]
MEIQKLKKRVKKLESKKKSRTPQLKRRLFKVKIESSAKKSLGDQEGASKQGRNEIDQDEGVLWFQEDSETQGRYGHDTGVNTTSTSITTASINITTAEPVTTASAPITTAGVSVSTAEPSTPLPPITTTFIKDEDLIIAQTLMKMRSVKSKEKSKEKGVSSETATRLARGVIVKEASETATRPTVPPPRIDPKDKGKAIMQEPEKPMKKSGLKEKEKKKLVKLQTLLNEMMFKLMDADYELAIKLQAKEKGKVSIVKRKSYIDADQEDEVFGRILSDLQGHSLRSKRVFEYILLMKIKLLIKKLEDSEVMIITAASYVSTAGEDSWNTLSYYCC